MPRFASSPEMCKPERDEDALSGLYKVDQLDPCKIFFGCDMVNHVFSWRVMRSLSSAE